MDQKLFAAVDEYINDLFAPEDAALQAAQQSIAGSGIPDASISASQGSFLQLMARLVRASRILEIGTFAGYSTIWLARGLTDTGRLTTIEANPVHAELAKANLERAGLTGRVDLRIGKALDLLPELAAGSGGPFDMVFIDADKPPYTEYFQWALRLSRPGALLIFDNVVREGKVLDPSSDDPAVQGVQRLNRALAAEPRVNATILATVGLKKYDGMAIALVR
ncbi:MAG TPA: O-methyltransferase [Puia sp.]|jgi:caffeoyl-CoA O-methyltransferase|nr:O-methyltransferase [Puia sp.]